MAKSINKSKSTASRKLLGDITKKTEGVITTIGSLETAVKSGSVVKMKAGMKAVRDNVDALEAIVPAENWPLPSYAEMLFIT